MLAFFLAEIESISSLEACRQRLEVLFREQVESNLRAREAGFHDLWPSRFVPLCGWL